MAGSGLRVRGAPFAPRFSPHAPLKRSLTVGTWSGWTDVVMTALSGGSARSCATPPSTWPTTSTPASQSSFRSYNIQQVRHGWYGGKESWPELGVDSWDGAWPANFSAPVVDFCLIDGGHSYTLASRDFKTLRTGCRVIAFHDIVNVRVGLTEVPRLWRELTDSDARALRARVRAPTARSSRGGATASHGHRLLVRKEGAAAGGTRRRREAVPARAGGRVPARRARRNGEADSETLANARGPLGRRGARELHRQLDGRVASHHAEEQRDVSSSSDVVSTGPCSP